jgi:hypothetical protein
MIGEIRDNTMMPGFKMIHNSVAILNGNQPDEKQMKFYWDNDKKERPNLSLFLQRLKRRVLITTGWVMVL